MVSAPRGTPRARPRLRASLVAAAVASLALLVPSAASAKKWVVKGAGFGHGTGMSQYGAKGFAARGTPYSSILGHYYTGTTLGTAPSQTVRVLLRPYLPSARFRGAGSACGVGLKPGKTYVAKRKGAGVVLRTKKGIRVAKCSGLLSATGAPTVELIGKGAYRGALEVRPSSVPGRLNAINAVEIEDYLKGVVPKESPASWPIEALKAQAVAARSYAIATPVKGNGFDQYDDTRSQLYAGVSAEATRTNQAVDATRSQVVLYNGKVAQTFFFSTSGGHTENNEHSSLRLRRHPDPLPAWRPRPLRGRGPRALLPLEAQVLAREDEPSLAAWSAASSRKSSSPSGGIPADRAREPDREPRHHHRYRPAAPRRARAARHLGHLQEEGRR